MTLKITVGSTSQHKLGAVRNACETLGLDAIIVGVAAASGQDDQPVGLEATYYGALARAIAAQAGNPHSITIGIEGGYLRCGGPAPITLCVAIVAVLLPDGRRIITTSNSILLPEEHVLEAERRGCKLTTVGAVIAEKLGGDPTDPHTTLTGGRITRTMTLTNALIIALQQL